MTHHLRAAVYFAVRLRRNVFSKLGPEILMSNHDDDVDQHCGSSAIMAEV